MQSPLPSLVFHIEMLNSSTFPFISFVFQTGLVRDSNSSYFKEALLRRQRDAAAPYQPLHLRHADSSQSRRSSVTAAAY